MNKDNKITAEQEIVKLATEVKEGYLNPTKKLDRIIELTSQLTVQEITDEKIKELATRSADTWEQFGYSRTNAYDYTKMALEQLREQGYSLSKQSGEKESKWDRINKLFDSVSDEDFQKWIDKRKSAPTPETEKCEDYHCVYKEFYDECINIDSVIPSSEEAGIHFKQRMKYLRDKHNIQ